MEAARARDAVAMVVVIVVMRVVLNRSDEVRRWAFLTECWCCHRGRYGYVVREVTWAQSQC